MEKTKRGGLLAIAFLLFVPAVVTALSPPAGLASGAAAVVVLVYLALRNERRTP